MIDLLDIPDSDFSISTVCFVGLHSENGVFVLKKCFQGNKEIRQFQEQWLNDPNFYKSLPFKINFIIHDLQGHIDRLDLKSYFIHSRRIRYFYNFYSIKLIYTGEKVTVLFQMAEH